jgi:transposase
MSHRRSSKQNHPASKRTAKFEPVHPNAAGVDVHSEFHFVAVPDDRDEQPVRRFGAFTEDLVKLADWLTACGITSVAMESTGVYWIPLFEFLEKRGFHVVLVDPRKLKSVPGRKSDVRDCQWLQQLHTFGLLAAAFRPDEQTCVLRAYLRQRSLLVEESARHIQRMQKSLEQMNVKLEKVLSDITGVTGMLIIDAILSGERDPDKLAELRDVRCHNDEATIAKALHGQWRDEHLFTLRQARDLYRMCCTLVAECDTCIEQHLQTYVDVPKFDQAPKVGRRTKARPRRKTFLRFDAQPLLIQKTGADLTQIDGIDSQTALTLISEIGLDMTRWPTEKHFASWLALCPENRQSAGRRKSGKTRPSANRAAAALRMAAHSLHRSASAMGAYLRRMKASLGAPKAITATARKLALMVFRVLKHQMRYVDPGQDWYERHYRERVIHAISRKARQLGYILTPISPAKT